MLSRIFPSRTIGLYMARLFLVRTAAFLIGLTVVLMSLDLLGESGRILAVPGNGEAELWKYVSIRVPQIISLFLPFSVLLAALLTFMTLNQNSEITIFRAAGISPHQILAPLILAGLAISAVNFAFNERLLVRAKAEYDRWKAVDYHPLTAETATGGEVWVQSDGNLWHARAIDRESLGADADEAMLRDVTIYVRENDKIEAVIHADEAMLTDAGWSLNMVRWFDVASGELSTSPQQNFSSPATMQQFTVESVNADHLPYWQLAPAIRELKAAGKPTDLLVAKLNHKIAAPLSAALMPLLGSIAAFGLARAGGLFFRAVAGLALGFAYFVADNFAMAMADFGTYPPWAAAWAPVLLFFLVGETLLFRTEE